MSNHNNFSKNFFFIALFILVILSSLIIRPLFVILVAAAIFAYLFHPVYRFISNKTNSKRFAAILITILLIMLTIIPTYFAANALTKEGYSLFLLVKQKVATYQDIEEMDCTQSLNTFCNFGNRIVSEMKDPQVKYYIEDTISKVSNYIIGQTSKFIVNLPIIIVNLFVMFFVIFYLLIDGTALIEKAKRSIPLKKHHVDHIMGEFSNFTYATLYGNLITSLIQGIIGSVVFFLLGIQTPILAGVAMAFFAFIPFLGTPIIWLPVSVTLLLTGEVTKGIILLLFGVFIISTIDNIIKPQIIGLRVKLHPALVLVGIIGGMYLLGPIGILAGPLIFSLLISFIEVYYKEGLGFDH